MKNLTKCLVLLGAILAMGSSALAEDSYKTTFSLKKEAYVAAKKAQVMITVNATLKENEVQKARTAIMDKLNRIAPEANWQLVSFTQVQNNSDLIDLKMQAIARISEAALTKVKDEAKKESTPGMNFTVSDVSYQPTLAEFEATKEKLRQRIYENVIAEQKELEKIFAGQKFIVDSIEFNDFSPMVNFNVRDGLDNDNLKIDTKVTMEAKVSLSKEKEKE